MSLKQLKLQESPKLAAEDGGAGTGHWGTHYGPVPAFHGPRAHPALAAPGGSAKRCRKGELQHTSK